MAAMDVDVKEGVDQETVDAGRSAVGVAYKYGWNDDEIEDGLCPKG